MIKHITDLQSAWTFNEDVNENEITKKNSVLAEVASFIHIVGTNLTVEQNEGMLFCLGDGWNFKMPKP